MYINGQPDQPNSRWVTLSGKLTNCPDFIIGKGPTGTLATWNGRMDDVRLFPKLLSTNEIFALNGFAPGYTNRNAAPLVDAGTNVTVQVGLPLTLAGTSSDDGLPNPPGLLTNTWSQVYTNTVTIPASNSVTTTLTFTNDGAFTFRLTADDSDIASFAEVVVTVILPTRIDITADTPDAYELGPVNGSFTLTRTGDTNSDLTVYLGISGVSSNGVDYTMLTNTYTFTGGSNTIAIPILPILDYAIEGDESLILTVQTNLAYIVGNSPATVTIHDSPYGLWSIANFSLEELTHPLISGASADFDSDGVKNFAEYAFNHDPRAVDGNPPYQWSFETSTNDNKPHLTLTWTRRLPPRDVEYGVYVSTNLIDWNTGTNYVQEFLHTNDVNNLTETVKTRALVPFPNSTKLFMNIRVWLQQVPAP